MTLRRVEVLRGDEWVVIRLQEAVNGDIVRMFEDEWNPVLDKDGNSEFRVSGVPYIHPDFPDVYTINCEGRQSSSHVVDGGEL